MSSEIEAFLRSVERRGLLMARIALDHEADALDCVQDAMINLVRHYASRPPQEWRPLFYRILRSRISDTRRRRRITARLFGWMPRQREEEDAAPDPLDDVAGPDAEDPATVIQNRRAVAAVAEALRKLPTRQQQAFMLRCWDGLSTAETALSMGCSEGSVKTHYSRALHSLREQLGEHWS